MYIFYIVAGMESRSVSHNNARYAMGIDERVGGIVGFDFIKDHDLSCLMRGNMSKTVFFKGSPESMRGQLAEL